MFKNIQRHQRYFVGIIAVILVIVLIMVINSTETTVTIDWDETTLETGIVEDGPEEFQTTPEQIMVDIKGEVLKPDVYLLPAGSRMYEVIDMAGGLTDQADERQLNLAQLVEDEMVIYVPTYDELWDATTIHQQTSESNGKVLINKADVKELETLPGIGPKKADAIIAYREEHGPFRSIEELQNVSGIGEKSIERLEGEIDFR
ncbi:helix-hairpin-helix domain-containing protein [Bacillus sp. JCM 19034]|uniref:helix-hairpin-helix domain-containing protein n=1 Tax=Bacillus sp. JCM 19034 TaxID=1481928 RepID=UPI000780D6A4|nr:helix-hairpin-helix domain-containing protein [Bacillus sp. JCM 19034]